MRKLALTGLTLTIVLAVAGIAIAQYAQPTVNITEAKVTPKKAGTKKKPKNGRTHIKFEVPEQANATLSGIKYDFDKGIVVNGKGFPVCAAKQVAQDESKCPKASQVGTGAATAVVGPQHAPQSFVAKVFYSGGKTIQLKLRNPATPALAFTFPGVFSKTFVRFNIPTTVQQPAPGLYSYVTSVTADLGKGAGGPAAVTTGKGKKKKSHFFVSIVGCKANHHTIGVRAYFAANPNPPAVDSATDKQTVACKA